MKNIKLFTLLAALMCTTATWADNYSVNTDSKLREAIQNDGANITLTADIDLSNSTLEITSNRTVTINMNNHTLNRKLTGRPSGAGQVFTVRSGSTLNLNGGTVKGGWGGAGGGINNEGTCNLTNVIITGNTADDRGGGIVNKSGCTLTMTGCTITGNTSNNHTNPKGGGGIYNAGTLKIQGKNIVTGNTAGGSTNNLFLETGTVITVTGSLKESNTNISHIGITLQGTTGIFTSDYCAYNNWEPSAYFTSDDDMFYDVTRSSNEACVSASEVVGPVTTESLLRTVVATDGVKIKLGSDITVSKHLTIPGDVTIDLNGFTLRGDDTPVTTGGDYKCIFIVAPEGNLNLSNGTLADADNSATDNTTHNGGAIVNKGTATLTGVTITHCKGTDGAGIRNNEGATLTIDGCSIIDNTGDGIYNEGTLNMKGAITVTGNMTTELLNDNVYLKNSLINVIGSLAGSNISINLVRSGVFTSNYSDYNSGIDPSTYFTADYTNVFGVEFSGTEAALTGGPFYYIDREWDEDNKIVVASVKKLTGHVVNSMEEFDPYYDKLWLDNEFYVFNRDDLNFHGDVVVSGGRRSKILLCDGSKLSIGEYGGLLLVALNSSDTPVLSIYGQLKNSGQLVVRPKTYEKFRAGIGTCSFCLEPVNIYGGTLDVEGSSAGGAGIGTAAGFQRESAGKPVLRELNIYGGIIKAKGGPGAAGIGSGRPGGYYTPEDYGNINIYGGTITATGGSVDNTFSADVSGAGIGGGGGNHQGNLHIYGGNITATGGLDAAGIGCGQSATSAGNIIIEGGYVYAQGNDYGAGIGGGENCAGANVTITGGTVIAKAGYNETGNRAIGPGHGNDNYGSLDLGDNIMVTAERTFTAAERKGGCWYRTNVTVEPCTHQNATYTISGTTDEDTHTLQCAYCLDHTTEQHSFHNGTCTVCGVGATAYAVRIYLPEDKGGGTYDGQTYTSQTTQMVPGSTFIMPPSPTTVPGLEFMGWEVSSVTGDYESPYTSTDGGTILEAGDEYTINNSVSFIARYQALDIILENNADNGLTLLQYSGMTANSVTLNGRTLAMNGDWNTLCLPFNVDDISITLLADATVKTLESTAFNSSTGTLTMNFSTNNLTSIVAGKPYIVKWAPALEISTSDEWDTFATNVNNGTSYEGQLIRLTNSITVSTMVGEAAYPFKGTFDGRGYTLTFNKNSGGENCAPFRYVDGATIKNLNIAGTINAGNNKFAAGLIAFNKGNTTVSNCHNSITINSTLNGDGTHGGFIARLDGGAVTITNCLFDGTLSGNKTTNCGGFVGWTETNNSASVTFNYCLFNPATLSMGGGCKTYARLREGNPTFTNSFYKKTLGDAQGFDATSMSDDELLNDLGSGWMVRNGNIVPKMPSGSERVFYDVTIQNTTNDVETDYVDFVGTFSPVDIEGEDKSMYYMGTGSLLYYPNAAMTIGSCRAYFRLKGITAGDPTGNASILNFNLKFGDENDATGIRSMDNGQWTMDNCWYDLQGRLIANGHKPTAKGVYIYNGKKQVIK